MRRHATLDVIHDEHQALAAMLRSLGLTLMQSSGGAQPPDFALLRAMLFYVDEFPERLHHPKESELLFPLVRERCPELTPVLDRLDGDHAGGPGAIGELQHALLAWEVLGDSRRAAFEQMVERYIHGYLEHMALEETEVLTAARRVFTAADWAELDAAFSSNRDPLIGHEPAPDYRPLFKRLLAQVEKAGHVQQTA